MTCKVQEGLDTATASPATSLRDVLSAPQTTPWPFSGRVHHADQPLPCCIFKAGHILNSRSVGAFMDKCHASYKVGSAKKNWKPLYWLAPPRPPGGAIFFPSLFGKGNGVCLHLGCQKMQATETFLRTLALWTMNTLPAGTTADGLPHAYNGTGRPCLYWPSFASIPQRATTRILPQGVRQGRDGVYGDKEDSSCPQGAYLEG